MMFNVLNKTRNLCHIFFVDWRRQWNFRFDFIKHNCKFERMNAGCFENEKNIGWNKNFLLNMLKNSSKIVFGKFCVTHAFVEYSINLFKISCKKK